VPEASQQIYCNQSKGKIYRLLPCNTNPNITDITHLELGPVSKQYV